LSVTIIRLTDYPDVLGLLRCSHNLGSRLCRVDGDPYEPIPGLHPIPGWMSLGSGQDECNPALAGAPKQLVRQD